MAWLISSIIGIIVGVGQATASYYANKRNTVIATEASRLAKEMSKDSQLIEELMDAYNRKDSNLMNNIMMSSPFGTRLHNLKQQYTMNQRSIKDLKERKVSIAEEQAKLNSQINKAQISAQTTGSVIGDLIKGGGSLTKTEPIDPYIGSGLNQNNLKEVNYGSKN